MITGVLLLHMPPDQAFWLLAHIVEVLLPDYYSKSLTGSVVDQRIFNSIVSKHLPHLAEHLAEVGVMLDLITYGWFLCLFIGYVPWQVRARSLQASMHMLDVIFAEGSELLFQIGLALFMLNEASAC